MVTSEEIKRKLEAKRKRVKTPSHTKQVSSKGKTSNEEIKRRLEIQRSGVKPLSREKESGLEANICPKCETKNPHEAKFCVGCGEKLKEKNSANLPPDTVKTEISGISSSSRKVIMGSKVQYKICPECKQKNKLNAKFCVICGNKFVEESSPRELFSTTQPTQNNVIGDSFPTGKEDDNLGDRSEEIVDNNQKIPETKAFPQMEVMKSSDRKETDIPPKNELKSVDKKTETVSTSGPVDYNEKPEGLSENFDPVEKIRKAKELLDMGAITIEEFEKIKNKYLEKI